MKPLRILHAVPSLDPKYGGPSRSVPQLCEALAAEEHHRIELLTTHQTNHNSPPEILHVKSTHIPYTHLRATTSLKIAQHIYAQRKNIDLIHTHSIFNSVVSTTCHTAKTLGIPYIITPRGMLDTHCMKQHTFLKKLYSKTCDWNILQHASAVHCLNNDEATHITQQWNIPKERIFVAPNGIHPHITHLSNTCLPTHPPQLIFLGRLNPIKNIPLQLQALALIKQKFPSVLLHIVGPDDGERTRLEKTIQELHLEKNTSITGPIHNNQRFHLLTQCDALLQTSLYECHSMSLNEALLTGTPCIITPSAHFPDIHKAHAGYLTEATPHALANAIDRLFSQSIQERQNMQKAAKTLAQNQLTWPHIARKVIANYEKIIEKRQKKSGNA
jgi:glycosyltransferase involved in cell wall biosynthesis